MSTAHIERIIESLNLIEKEPYQTSSVRENVFNGLAWSFAASWVGVQTTIAQLEGNSPEDLDKLTRLEKRADEYASVIGWINMYTGGEYAPDPEVIIERMTQPSDQPATDEAHIQFLAEAFEITVEQARKDAAKGDALMKERAEIRRGLIKQNRDYLVKGLTLALEQDPGTQFELSDVDTRRMLEKIADKCEQYAQNRYARSATSRRARTIQKLAAEHKLLISVMNEADSIGGYLSNQIEAQGPESRVN